MTDHFAQLSKELQSVVRRAEQKALWESRPVRLRSADKEVNAYPVRRSGGKICWNVVDRENNQPIAWGVL
jgi:hypothetical protein